MRTTLIISAVVHAAVLAWAVGMFVPQPFAPAPVQTMMVDLVPPPEPDKDPESLIAEPATRPPESLIAEPATRPPEPLREPAAPSPSPQFQAGPSAFAAANMPGPGMTAPAANGSPGMSFPPVMSGVPTISTAPVVSALPNQPALLDATPSEAAGSFEPMAELPSDMSRRDVNAFMAHVKKCWKAPGGVGDVTKLKLIMRVYLSRKGTLAKEPMLLEATASPAGPALVQAALRALQQCQPYSFLPADRYNEWKVIDLNVSGIGAAGR